ncbi:SET domain-containing protein-lysine N-methyltransferase [Spirulina sp. 06S082]|uniref:SET domain-containing protein-lysine N-methyltransferase n=1 Tax=Spirulina sp. 06S082 TaxID=3110248 RepID=UPI002B1FF113|nr:SET domain-containing protein-lysine N-methyltransferase [Spirulina sp. 06S082]MEA5468608.1 SET domain-containing protein-lysine N-methyltransferase [Spirulina sp. 06S082]
MQIAEDNLTASPFAKIRECPTTGDKSLWAAIAFEQGQVISNFSAREVLDRPNYLTVQISDRQHIMLAPEYLQYINHSCDPNVFFDTKNMQVIAIRKIKRGEEFTFFYPSTEWSMDRGFDCLCQSENCLGSIQGATHIFPHILTKYNLSQYIQQKLES